MNMHFSLQRISWLLRKDWIEHKKSILYALGTFVVVAFPFLWLNTTHGGFSDSKQVAFYIVGSLGCFIYFCQFVGKKIHFSKGIYLTLPASTVEKYVTLLLEGVVLFATFNLLYWASLHLWSLVYPVFRPIDVATLYIQKQGASVFVFVASLIFLSYLTFKKYPLAIALIGMAAAIGSVIGILMLIVKTQFTHSFLSGDSWIDPNAIYSTVRFLTENINIAMGISLLIVLYIGYLKLKEKESR